MVSSEAPGTIHSSRDGLHNGAAIAPVPRDPTHTTAHSRQLSHRGEAGWKGGPLERLKNRETWPATGIAMKGC